MLLPEKLFNQVSGQIGGAWAHTDYNDFCALVLKLPSTTVKAIAMGARVELHLALTQYDECYTAIGVTVHDSPDSPFTCISPVCTIDCANGILSLSRRDDAHIYIYNELNHCVMHGELIIPDMFKSQILDHWSKIQQPYLVTDAEMDELLLDSVFHHIIPDMYPHTYFDVNLISESFQFDKLTKILTLEFDENSKLSYEISRGNEGDIQEEQLTHLLAYLFGTNVHLSPWKIRGNKQREFVDVFAYSSRFNLLVSSKAMTLLRSDYEKTLEKRVSTLVSHSMEALGQLFGTLKSIKRNEIVLTHDDRREIIFDRTLPNHAVVVISEFFNGGNKWQVVENEVKKISSQTGATIHLMDLAEFRNFLQIANESLLRLEMMLNKRFEVFLERNILNIQSIDSSLQTIHPSQL